MFFKKKNKKEDDFVYGIEPLKFKNIKDLTFVTLDGVKYAVKPELAEKITDLKIERREYINRIKELEEKLAIAKEEFEYKYGLTLAKSHRCRECVYGVPDHFDHTRVLCGKNSVCEDFRKER